MKSVKVSILIPTYNSEKYIEETIESALVQTYKNFEIIIVDNASNDNTFKIMQEYAKKHDNIKIFKNEENIGPIKNWMKCISEASGKYGKILWSDDLIKNIFLEKTVNILEENQNVGFVFTPVIIFGDTPKEKIFYDIYKNSGIFNSKGLIEGVLFDKDYPSSPGCGLFRLKDLEKNLLLKIPNNFNSDSSMHAIGNDLLIYLLTKKTKMVLNYDIAKTYFVDNYIDDIELIRKFNAVLWLHDRIFKTNNYLNKFYFKNKEYKKNIFFLIRNICSYDVYIKRALRKFFL